MTHPMKPAQIAIGNLVDHPANVRAKDTQCSQGENIAHLASSIHALGLIQPILVQEIDGGYGVLAGKRRAAALASLVADKSIKGFSNKTKVDVRVIAKDCDVTTALSLAENITQEPMGAIEQFEAYARMMEVDGQTPESIALTFGTTQKAVKERLRIGLVHPDIRDAARRKEVTLDVLKAFANHPSQSVQLEVYSALNKEGNRPQVWSVNQALKTRGLQVGDPLGALVREEYEARGGEILRDLIDEHSVMEDMALIETILREKLLEAAEADRAALGFAWADTMVMEDHAVLAKYARVYPQSVDLDEATEELIASLEDKVEALEAEMERDDISDEAYDEKDTLRDQIWEQIRDLQEAYTKDDLASAGVIAVWARDEIQLRRGLVKPAETSQSIDADGGPISDDTDGAGPSSKNAADDAETTSNDKIEYSVALRNDLRVERAMALGAAVAQNPEAATDLALFMIAAEVFCHRKPTYAFNMSFSKEYRSHAKMDEIDETSLEQMATIADDLDLSWAADELNYSAQFEAFRRLDAAEKAKLVAYAMGSATRDCSARNLIGDPLMHGFELEVMPDIRAHWTPNAALFNRFKKAWLLQILSKDLGLANEAVQLSGKAKKEIVAFMDKLFAEPFATLNEQQLEAVATWCPPEMQTTQEDNSGDEQVEDARGDTEGATGEDEPEIQMAA